MLTERVALSYSHAMNLLMNQNCITAYDPLVGALSPNDQAEYIRLAHFIATSEERNKRNLGMQTFIKHLSMIHDFIHKGDSKDNLRGLVCGIQFGHESLLINTSRLKKLMCRSKSCMNGCFQKMGYMPSRPSQELASLLCKITPGIRSEAMNPRNWCVRRASVKSQLFIQNVQMEIAAKVTTPMTDAPSASEDETSTIPSILNISLLLNH